MRKYIQTFVIALVVGFCGFATAQVLPKVPAEAPAVQKAPSLDDTESLMVQVLALSQQLTDCRGQLGQRNLASLSADVIKRIEAKHPGFTLDVKTGQLVPKK